SRLRITIVITQAINPCFGGDFFSQSRCRPGHEPTCLSGKVIIGIAIMAKHKRPKTGPYIPVMKAIIQTPAWRAMSPKARLLWIELRGWLKNDWTNNGHMFLSCRDAAEAIGINKNTVYRKYVELEHFGFLCRTAEGFLGGDGYGIATKFRFTDLPY